jgi:hypothetical protein
MQNEFKILLKPNLCTALLLPLLRLNNSWLKKEFKGAPRLVNCYVKWENNIEDLGNLIVVINTFQSTDYLQEIAELEYHSRCKGRYDIEGTDSTYTALIFDMEDVGEYDLFIEGKYSEFSDWAQQLCIEKGLHTGVSTLVAKPILEKSDSLREYLEKDWGLTPGALIGAELAPLYDQATLGNILTRDIEIALSVNANKKGKIKTKLNYG